ncbi:MAG: TatD family hydrolase [Cyanobacteria bacterium P01_H01_bin.121]
MTFADSHAHLSFYAGSIATLLQDCHHHGIERLAMAGYDPPDWQQQLALQQQFPKQLFACLGLHPWVVAQSSEAEVTAAIALAQQLLPQAQLCGEIGLDKLRPQLALQHVAFKQQLRLSRELQKPIVLHVVQQHGPALDLLQTYANQYRGFVHGFSGSYEVAQRYLKLGIKLSIGPLVLRNNAKKLRTTITQVQLADLIIESDQPSQPGERDYDPTQLLAIAQTVAELRGDTTGAALLKQTNCYLDSLLQS